MTRIQGAGGAIGPQATDPATTPAATDPADEEVRSEAPQTERHDYTPHGGSVTRQFATAGLQAQLEDKLPSEPPVERGRQETVPTSVEGSTSEIWVDLDWKDASQIEAERRDEDAIPVIELQEETYVDLRWQDRSGVGDTQPSGTTGLQAQPEDTLPSEPPVERGRQETVPTSVEGSTSEIWVDLDWKDASQIEAERRDEDAIPVIELQEETYVDLLWTDDDR